MKRRFPIATDHFSKHRLANAYYVETQFTLDCVDKSLLISDILNDSEVNALVSSAAWR